MIEPSLPLAYSFDEARANARSAGVQSYPYHRSQYEKRVAAAQVLLTRGRFSGLAYCSEVGTFLGCYAQRKSLHPGVMADQNLKLVQRELDATAAMLWG